MDEESRPALSDQARFRGELLGARGGGHVVIVHHAVAASIGAKHLTRVRGTLDGADFRSNLVKMKGTLYLGVHKATIRAAGVAIGDEVDIRMALDTEPRTGDGHA